MSSKKPTTDKPALPGDSASDDKGYTLVGAVAVPSDIEAPNGVRITSDGIQPAMGVVTKDKTDDEQHILVADRKKAGAPDDVNQGVPEDEGGSNPPAFNSDGLRPGEAVDAETIARVNRENARRAAEEAAKAEAKK